MANIVLIGYRATGKTTVAKILAEQLGRKAVDADVVIEQRAGKSIAEIFADDGEPAFRDLESAVVADLMQQNGFVVSLGGGAPMREENRIAMRSGGTVFWLTASAETIVQRMSADVKTASQRPGLTDRGPLDEVTHVLAEREPVYREVAHHAIATEGRTPAEVAQAVAEAFQASDG